MCWKLYRTPSKLDLYAGCLLYWKLSSMPSVLEGTLDAQYTLEFMLLNSLLFVGNHSQIILVKSAHPAMSETT